MLIQLVVIFYVAITYIYFGSSNVHLPIVNDLFPIHRRLIMWRDIIACANLKSNFDDSVDDYNSLIDWHWCMIYIRCGFNIFRWLTRLSARFNNTRFNNILFCMLSYCIYRESSFIFQYQKWFNMIGGSKCIKIEWFTHTVFSKFSLQMCSYFLREIRVKITSSALSICFWIISVMVVNTVMQEHFEQQVWVLGRARNCMSRLVRDYKSFCASPLKNDEITCIYAVNQFYKNRLKSSRLLKWYLICITWGGS